MTRTTEVGRQGVLSIYNMVESIEHLSAGKHCHTPTLWVYALVGAGATSPPAPPPKMAGARCAIIDIASAGPLPPAPPTPLAAEVGKAASKGTG